MDAPSGSQIRLRTAERSDSPAVCELIFDVLAEYGLVPEPEETDADLVDVEAAYAGVGGQFVVLEDRAGVIQGSAGLLPTGGGVCELRKMYFRPEVRGQGVGKALLYLMIERARAMGFVELRLETASVLKEAIGLYESFGFLQLPGEVDVPRCDRAYRLILDQYRSPPPEIVARARALEGD